MFKLTALYSKPDDTNAFDDHFFTDHVELIKQVPGLLKYETVKIIGSTIGDTKYYLTCDMYFENETMMNVAMASPEGRRFVKDIMDFAASNVSVMYSEVLT